MEKVLVLYFISSTHEKIGQIPDETPNALELTVSTGKEIYLFDLLQQLKSLTNMGSSFNVFGYCSTSLNKWVYLNSPSSVIPVLTLDKKPTIFLHLIPSSHHIIVSPNQLDLFCNISRHKIYSNQNSSFLENQSPTWKVSSNNYKSSSNNENSSPSTQPQQSKSKVNRSTNVNPTQNVNQTNKSYPVETTDKFSNQYVNEDTVAALAEATKEAATNVAKSLFAWGVSSLKNVTEAASTISSGLNATTVGKTKVNIVKELAEGGFGKIFLVTDANNPNKQYAMKQMLCQTKDQDLDCNHEIQALQKFSSHVNIITLLDYGMIQTKQTTNIKTYLLLFPLCTHGTAWDAILRADPLETEGQPWPFTERKALMIILGVARALHYIHEQGFSHRDIKPHNILFNDYDEPLLTDFGSISAAVINITNRSKALILEEEAAMKTSAAYRPPELTTVAYPSVIDERVDIWSLGCTMYCLAFGWSPFESKREGVLRLAILNGRFTIPTGNRMRDITFSSKYIGLIQQMLQLENTKRPFAKDVVMTIERMLGPI